MILPDKFPLILEGIKNGKYNLFLGAGVSLDSGLPNGETLKNTLCDLTRIPKTNALTRVIKALSSDQMEKYITKVFSNTTPGPTLQDLPNYIWQRIFTINVDDVIENIYTRAHSRKQSLKTVNYTEPFYFDREKNNVQIIHLHGFAQRPEDGYVFSLDDYVHVIKNNNTWAHVLADMIATDSFIISGVSFNEPDFAHFSSYRTVDTPRKDMYPSLLIEPYPDAITEKDCVSKDIILIKGTFLDFMNEVRKVLPNPPSIYDLTIKTNTNLSDTKLTKNQLMLFFSEFEPISSCDEVDPNKNSITPFDYGFEPEQKDIIKHKDIQRNVTQDLYMQLLEAMKGPDSRLILVSGSFLNGKTTSTLRCLNDLASTGVSVFRLKSISGFDLNNTIECLNKADSRSVVYIDNVAEYIEKVTILLEKTDNLIIVATERRYRLDHVKKVLARKISFLDCDVLQSNEIKQLVEKYRTLGVISNRSVLNSIDNYILSNKSLVIGEHVCNILSDFTPINKKIPKLLSEYRSGGYDYCALIAICLSYHCYKQGVNYAIIQSILNPHYNLWKHFKTDDPFVFEFNPDDKDYVLPRNKLLAEQLFHYSRENDIGLVKKVYFNLITHLAAYVDRKTIMLHTPEARLAARMIDIDNTLKGVFGDDSEKFLIQIEKQWGWNSRYWEQRALCIINQDIDRAIRHAEQAVSIEYHPYTLTTLSNVLFKKMTMDPTQRDMYFVRAAKRALEAMKEEDRRTMVSIKPFMSLVNGCYQFSQYNKASSIEKQLCDNISAALLSFESSMRLTQTEQKRLQEIYGWLQIYSHSMGNPPT